MTGNSKPVVVDWLQLKSVSLRYMCPFLTRAFCVVNDLWVVSVVRVYSLVAFMNPAVKTKCHANVSCN